jgi:hypothetical protein
MKVRFGKVEATSLLLDFPTSSPCQHGAAQGMPVKELLSICSGEGVNSGMEVVVGVAVIHPKRKIPPITKIKKWKIVQRLIIINSPNAYWEHLFPLISPSIYFLRIGYAFSECAFLKLGYTQIAKLSAKSSLGPSVIPYVVGGNSLVKLNW